MTLKDEMAALLLDLEGKMAALQEEVNRMRTDLQAANVKLQKVSEKSVGMKMDLTWIAEPHLQRYPGEVREGAGNSQGECGNER